MLHDTYTATLSKIGPSFITLHHEMLHQHGNAKPLQHSNPYFNLSYPPLSLFRQESG